MAKFKALMGLVVKGLISILSILQQYTEASMSVCQICMRWQWHLRSVLERTAAEPSMNLEISAAAE